MINLRYLCLCEIKNFSLNSTRYHNSNDIKLKIFALKLNLSKFFLISFVQFLNISLEVALLLLYFMNIHYKQCLREYISIWC